MVTILHPDHVTCFHRSADNSTSSLSETPRGLKFGLTPLLSLRSKAHKVIREILLYIRARFAFKLDPPNFPTHINFLHTTLY